MQQAIITNGDIQIKVKHYANGLLVLMELTFRYKVCCSVLEAQSSFRRNVVVIFKLPISIVDSTFSKGLSIVVKIIKTKILENVSDLHVKTS